MHEVKQLIKKCTLTSFVALWMQSEGKAPKNGEPTDELNICGSVHHA